MRLGSVQPYFFPYLGHFDLIRQCDVWVFFDVAQYVKKRWMNRNRILHPVEQGEFTWITVPVAKHPRETPIADIRIADPSWHVKVRAQLVASYRKAPYFEPVIALFDYVCSGGWESLAELNIAATVEVCQYLDMKTSFLRASRINFDWSAVDGPGDWALAMAEQLCADSYINPIGGLEAGLFDVEKFAARGIEFETYTFQPTVYDCGDREWLPNLSILDVLMWNLPSSVSAYLDSAAVV